MDSSIMQFVQQYFHNPVTDFLFPVITMLGEVGLVWLCTALILLLIKKHRKSGVLLVAALAITYLLGEVILKNVICRPRPFMDDPSVALLIPPPSGFSFPSGHAASSFAAATMLLLLFHKKAIPALVMAILIAFSRIFLFVHYPSDVLAGAVLGTLCSLSLYALYYSWKRNHAQDMVC